MANFIKQKRCRIYYDQISPTKFNYVMWFVSITHKVSLFVVSDKSIENFIKISIQICY